MHFKPSALVAGVLLFIVALTGCDDEAATTRTPEVETSGNRLVVHYFNKEGNYKNVPVEATSFDGNEKGKLADYSTDAFGLKATFQFSDKASSNATTAYYGIGIKTDSVFAGDVRYVQAKDGVAEAWLIDGDARVFDSPVAIDPKRIVQKDGKRYVAVEDMKDQLQYTYKYGKNTNVFDGEPNGSANILTLYHDRDYFEINVDKNRLGSNVTSNMLKEYTSYVFSDIDGYKQDDKYYLSLGAIERLFQVKHLTVGKEELLLAKQFTAYDRISVANKPEDVGFSSEKLKAIDEFMINQIQKGFPAAAFIVVKDGKIVKESAYGDAKKYDTALVNGVFQPAKLLPEDKRDRATVDTLFDLASNTKMYATNYAIQKLVSEGKLDLDRKLVSFPGWENFKDSYTVYTGKFTKGETGKELVTIRDILHHSGGLIPDPGYPNKNSSGDLWYQTDSVKDRAGIIDMICKTPLQSKPKTAFAYSDVDYMILGLLAEQITGMPLDEYVEKQIYAPMGLSHTIFNPLKKGFDKSQIAATELNGNTRDGSVNFGKTAEGKPIPMRTYTLQGEVHDEKAWYSMAGVAGHAGLFSTTRDMGALTQLMLNGGIYNGNQFFTKEVAEAFVKPYDVIPDKVDTSTIGLGWRVHSKSSANYYYYNWGPSRSTYGHQGWTGTLTIIDPVYNMSIVILTNYRHSPVVNPPNGFEAGNLALADLVPLSAQVYQALLPVQK